MCRGDISRGKDARGQCGWNLQGAKAALERGCRLIHLSSAGVVGKSKNYLIDENTICQPGNIYESSKYKAEKIVLDGIANGLRAQILRPTIIFGAGHNENQDSFLQLLKAMKRRRYRNIGKGIYNLIHVNEVVRVMRMLDSDAVQMGVSISLIHPYIFEIWIV